MNNKIVSTAKAIELAKRIRKERKSIVLAGGCFDVLHIGHIRFLEKAKVQGDTLFVLLESDEMIKRTKGNHRPINTQIDRAEVLAALSTVDYVVLLPLLQNDEEYDRLVIQLKPAIIATTKGDREKFHKERAAKLIAAEVIEVINAISNQSTSRLIAALHEI